MICYRQNLTIHYESHDSLGSGFVLSLKETGGIPKRFVIFIYSQDQFLECPISANRFLVYSISSVSCMFTCSTFLYIKFLLFLVCSLVVLSCILVYYFLVY